MNGMNSSACEFAHCGQNMYILLVFESNTQSESPHLGIHLTSCIALKYIKKGSRLSVSAIHISNISYISPLNSPVSLNHPLYSG